MMDRSKIPGLVPGQRHPDWTVLYQTAEEKNLPWYFERIDPDFEIELKTWRGAGNDLLDIGSGLGNQAYLMSRLGFNVTASDISVSAVQRARRRYRKMRFEVDDITNTQIKDSYDIVADRGCFHTLSPDHHAAYLTSMKRLLKPQGVLFLKVFNAEMGASDFGPLRFSLRSLHRIFGGTFEILKIRRSAYQGSTAVSPVAWFCVMRRKDS